MVAAINYIQNNNTSLSITNSEAVIYFPQCSLLSDDTTAVAKLEQCITSLHAWFCHNGCPQMETSLKHCYSLVGIAYSSLVRVSA